MKFEPLDVLAGFGNTFVGGFLPQLGALRKQQTGLRSRIHPA